MSLKSAFGILKETVNSFLEDRALRLAAATAYYAMFSIGPLLVLVVGVAGLVFGEETVRGELGQQLQSFVGPKLAGIIVTMMSPQQKGDRLLATIIGGVALVSGATGVFVQLQDALNTIWGVTTKPGKSIGAFIRGRLFSMAMVLSIGFLLLVSMALTAFVSAFTGYIGNLISLPGWVAEVFNGIASFIVISVLFALIFKVLPDVKVRWRDVWAGAILTALLFTAGKYLLGRYLAHTNPSAYGAGGAFVVVLLYVYYSSAILYFGAEFTKVYAKRRGSKMEPSPYAVPLTEHQRAQQGMPTNQQVEAAAQQRDAGRPHSNNGAPQPKDRKE